MRDPWRTQAIQPNPIVAHCENCNKTLVWNQAGDVPKYCDNCYHRLKGLERVHTPKWDRSLVPEDGSFLDRVDAIVHFSPEINKWYLREPDRWVKATEVEIERLFAWLWWEGRGNPSCNQRSDEVELYRKMMSEYKIFCTERVKKNARS